MGDEDDRLPLAPQLSDLLVAFLLERFISNGKYLIHEENVGIGLDCR